MTGETNRHRSSKSTVILAAPDAIVKEWDKHHVRTLKNGDAAHRTALAKLKIWFPEIGRAV
jgi:hypothetical protein